MRETSKELGDMVADRFPVAPAAVNSQYLVDHMVGSVLRITCFPHEVFTHVILYTQAIHDVHKIMFYADSYYLSLHLKLII